MGLNGLDGLADGSLRVAETLEPVVEVNAAFADGIECLVFYAALFIVCHKSIIFITFAGTPPTIALAGTSLVTTAPAATMALSPMVTPCRMVTFAPSHTFLPMCIGLAIIPARCAGSGR